MLHVDLSQILFKQVRPPSVGEKWNNIPGIQVQTGVESTLRLPDLESSSRRHMKVVLDDQPLAYVMSTFVLPVIPWWGFCRRRPGCHYCGPPPSTAGLERGPLMPLALRRNEGAKVEMATTFLPSPERTNVRFPIERRPH